MHMLVNIEIHIVSIAVWYATIGQIMCIVNISGRFSMGNGNLVAMFPVCSSRRIRCSISFGKNENLASIRIRIFNSRPSCYDTSKLVRNGIDDIDGWFGVINRVVCH